MVYNNSVTSMHQILKGMVKLNIPSPTPDRRCFYISFTRFTSNTH